MKGTTNPVMRRVWGSRSNHFQGTDGGIPQQIIRQQESKYKRERHSQSVETPTRPTVSSGYAVQEFTNAGFFMSFELQCIRITHFKQKHLHLFLFRLMLKRRKYVYSKMSLNFPNFTANIVKFLFLFWLIQGEFFCLMFET